MCFRGFILAVALNCLGFGAAAQDAELRDTQQQGPWFTGEQQSAQTGASEYFAITRSNEDIDFWFSFACLGDKRVYLSLGNFGGEGFRGNLFSIEIRFDAGPPVFAEGKFVNAKVIAVDPTVSERILVALIDSKVIEITISGRSEDVDARSFDVQPCLPALSKLIAACSAK